MKPTFFIMVLALVVMVGCGESLRDAADVEDPEPEFVACMEERFGPDHKTRWERIYALHADGVDREEGFILTGHTYGCWEVNGAPRGPLRPG